MLPEEAAPPAFRAALASWQIPILVSQEELLRRYAALVLDKDRSLNLTAAADEAEILRRHVLDALAILPWLRANGGPAPTLADIGAGAGFIGLSLKIAWPGLRLTLIESVRKKADFLEWVCDRLALDGVEVVCRRAEEVAREARTFGFVLARALAPMPRVLELGLPLSAPGGGWFLAYRSEAQGPGGGLTHALERLGGELNETFLYRLPGEAGRRAVLCFRRR